MAEPSNKQIRAVRDVIYDRKTLRKLSADAGSIEILMNINNPNEPDGGPVWTIDATGEPSGAVIESIRRCRRIATRLRRIRDDLDGVDIPGEDRRDLREGLKELAAGWDATAVAWESPGQPDVESAAATIDVHWTRAAKALRGVDPYLKQGEDLPGERA